MRFTKIATIEQTIYFPKRQYRVQYSKTGLPGNFIAGRPKAALLFWFFGDFRCGVLLFMIILVIINEPFSVKNG